MLPSRPDHLSHTALRHLWLTDAEAHALEARLRAMAAEPHPTTDSARGKPYRHPDRYHSWSCSWIKRMEGQGQGLSRK
ncbi:hypothetical protein CP981_36125 [Streptomyces platensis]|uniref:Uncharacterized protein n=1 Tax=Streptomyces platensis TaxID=58346 RepID=A0AAE6NPE5_STRPT|nr:hypothetical protein [Streptomyces platensis]OSY41934.1 hypothetical protein BG653_04993 [Streptomyces platensis]QEV56308.1 hypothetical protein CP981_36125 [Streptomyces platensis]